MSPELVLDLFGRALYLTLIMVAIIIGPSLIVGLIVSIFQAATQINEQTLSFLPRLLATLVTLIVVGPWLVQELIDLTSEILLIIPQIII